MIGSFELRKICAIWCDKWTALSGPPSRKENGYLANKKPRTPLGPPEDPRQRPTVMSKGMRFLVSEVARYRGTSPTRKNLPPGPYSRPMLNALRWT